MVELFRNPRIDWINSKKFFIGLTIALLLMGAISVQIRGFNAGVDFTGGTLMTVAFKQMPSLNDVRSALADAGIDTSKVTLQPVTSRPNELQIRAPQFQSGSVDEGKRVVIRALQKLSPEGDLSQGKVNINAASRDNIERELREVDPLGINNRQFSASPYQLIANQVLAARDQQPQKFVTDINAMLAAFTPNLNDLPEAERNTIQFDPNKIKEVIASRFYGGKIDVNIAGVQAIQEALERINPLGANKGDYDYATAAKAISDYRKNVSGFINSLSDAGLPDNLVAAMQPYFVEGSIAVTSADVVGAVVGEDLRNRAIYVTLAALAGMLIYIAFRFEWIYGVAAVMAVFHDVLITLGFFSLFQWEISLTVIAALLTLVGYSMNDTIVIFDRIRENLRLRRKDSLVQISNDSINQTLSRTVITSGLTFISVLAIVLFGGEVLRGFALALTIGIVIGTYSSIAVATPIMLWWEYIVSGRGKRKLAEAKQRAAERERTLARV
ncbi:MAG TPA: protein translocase subunit SecF [Blastocatellia bacterium]|nr:protein translocase subunit SecF [Blastocatellia bacterium]